MLDLDYLAVNSYLMTTTIDDIPLLSSIAAWQPLPRREMKEGRTVLIWIANCSSSNPISAFCIRRKKWKSKTGV